MPNGTYCVRTLGPGDGASMRATLDMFGAACADPAIALYNKPGLREEMLYFYIPITKHHSK
ncbi:MAG: hypothetical protein ABI440_08605 [Casimicrobiaceae bacterium]